MLQSQVVLCYIVKDGRMLLIHKKRGIGAGKMNGPGGKVDPGETPLEAAVRETREEVGVTPTDLRLGGELEFQFESGKISHCFVYIANGYLGEPRETVEAVPQWFEVDRLPYERMWEDDQHWLPWLITKQYFRGIVVVKEESATSFEFKLS